MCSCTTLLVDPWLTMNPFDFGEKVQTRPTPPHPTQTVLENAPGTYLIRRAFKNDRDPWNGCSKRCHERQVMKVFVQRVIRSCFANNLRLLRKCTMVPWYHGTMVPWYHGTMVRWYHGTMVPEASPVFSTSAWYYVIRGAPVLPHDF